MNKFTKLAAAAAVATAFSTTTMAATTDGALATSTTTATLEVLVNKNTSISATGLVAFGDADYGTHATFANLTATHTGGIIDTDFCVFSSTGGYTITLGGKPDFALGTDFNMSNNVDVAATDYIIYEVEYLDGAAVLTNAAATVNDGVTTYGTMTTAGSDPTCSGTGGINTTIRTIVDGTSFDAATPGFIYNDTLTIVYTAI